MVLHFKLGNRFIKNVREKVCNKSKKTRKLRFFKLKKTLKSVKETSKVQLR